MATNIISALGAGSGMDVKKLALEAAQSSFAKISKLSLFNYIN